jgi:hypothetical protein
VAEVSRTFKNYKKGIVLTRPMVSITVAGAGGVQNLAILTAGRTQILRKLTVRNRQLAPVDLLIGEGGVQRMVLLQALNGVDQTWGELDLQDWEFTATITIQSTAAAVAPNEIQCQATVEEIQGPTG